MSIYDFSFRRLDGSEQAMADYRGSVLLLVNTASRCGFTSQYAGLEALHRRFGPQGLAIIGFPCNQFGAQEPGDAGEIGAFCQKNYGVDFAMADKVDVNGANAHPLWQYLKRQKRGLLGQAIRWNFSKFLVDRQGRVVARFAPFTRPEKLAARIEALLK
ncbi:glutathione peroxidase [Chromobacterium violaceum]|uniref:Glutathione peroxidase n=2 Tax=Chromobacterium violaceum TaxID=536 RepID=Q7NS71_CHRVO|nr:glutathione peroxidase [Chromobacterium violaceum]AAQ61217.1 probable glutathione peroxidase protein [Chromobacterium violaceum ATCC 12472]SUX88123.1 Glutathione peroxidase homolog BsaA [Chromobacterium violaceum]